jgi:hypothetical protein
MQERQGRHPPVQERHGRHPPVQERNRNEQFRINRAPNARRLADDIMQRISVAKAAMAEAEDLGRRLCNSVY